jgi:hypothetical protein
MKNVQNSFTADTENVHHILEDGLWEKSYHERVG